MVLQQTLHNLCRPIPLAYLSFQVQTVGTFPIQHPIHSMRNGICLLTDGSFLIMSYRVACKKYLPAILHALQSACRRSNNDLGQSQKNDNASFYMERAFENKNKCFSYLLSLNF